LKEKTLNQISGTVSDNHITDFVPGNIMIGTLVGLSAEGRPLIICSNDTSQSLEAITTVPVNKQLIGRQVTLLFNNGDPKLPVIMGLVQNPLLDILEQQLDNGNHEKNENQLEKGVGNVQNEFYVDGKKVVIEAAEEIVLKCGDASITLTKSGKILIRGKYVLNRSSGVHRIMGGSVQIN